MRHDPAMTTYFAKNELPARPILLGARDIILGADPRITEYLMYGQPGFGYKDGFAAFTKLRGKVASLMFLRGARIPHPEKYPHMTGTHPSARFMTFANEGEVAARAQELAALTVAWCDFMDAGGEGGAELAKPPRAKKAVSKKAPAKKARSQKSSTEKATKKRAR